MIEFSMLENTGHFEVLLGTYSLTGGGSMAASKLISRLLERASLSQKNRLALAAPAQNIFWSFAELEERVFDLATHLSGGGSKYLLAHG